VGIAWLCGNCATLYQSLAFRTVTLRFAIKPNDERGRAVRLELFRYLVFVSRTTEPHDGCWWLEYQQYQESYFFFKKSRPALEPTHYYSQFVPAVN
jgi:hypothetical protein